MRLHLTLALITLVALVVTVRAARRHHFAFAQVQSIAEARSARPYAPLPDELPPQLKNLTPQQDAGIFSKETARQWKREGLPFQVDFYHQLNSNPQPHISPRIYIVKGSRTNPLPYSTTLFNFLNVTVNPPTRLMIDPPLPNTLGFAGFYVRYPDMGIGSNPGSLDGFFSALGSNYLRVLARDQVYGLSARGIAIDTSLENSGSREEFPVFTDWWLHQPGSTTDTELTLDAVLDGPSVAGAYEFRLRPGAVTSIDVHASLYFRQPVDRLGIAPFSSMYLFGENSSDRLKDTAHPEIHDSDGLLMQSADGEWNWQPLSQSDDKRTGAKGYQLQTYAYPEENPKGFGLLQRDRDFQHYQDLGMKYNVRPSAWVTPHSGFEKGEITLLERPSTDVNTDNVVLFWHPAEEIKAGDRKDYSYTIDFYMNDSARPPLAYCKQTLINIPPPAPPAPAPGLNAPGPAKPTPGQPAVPAKAPVTPSPATNPAPLFIGPLRPIPTDTTPVQFLVDFAGNGLENTPVSQPPDLDLSFEPSGTYLREKRVEKNSYDNSWRVTFTIIPYKPFVPTLLKARLLRNGRPLSETWNYNWHAGPPLGSK